MYGEQRRGGFNRGGMGMSPPVKVGDEMEVTIEAVGEKGDGLAKKNGFVLFVPGVKEGQNVRIRVTKVLRKVGFAEVIGEGAAPAEKTEESSEETTEEETTSGDSDSFGEESSEETTEESSEDSDNFGEEDQQ